MRFSSERPIFAQIADLLLEDRTVGEDTRREWIGKLRDSTYFMLSLVDDILDTTATEAGGFRLDKRMVDLTRLAGDVLESNNLLARRLGVRIVRAGMVGPCPALVDPTRMEQALNNLISNAVKFSSPGTEVTLSIERHAGNIQIAVVDHGQGMDEGEIARLFSAFGASSARSASGEKNTGLGLHIARRIVEAHEGTLVAKSAPGLGTTMEINLPEAEGDGGAPT